MLAWLLSPDNLVLGAGILYIGGYLMINQVALRVTILAGTVLWIAYYATVSDQPLWGAIRISALQGFAVAIGLFLLFASRSRLMIPARDKDIYDRFPGMPPGDFRAVMSLAKRHTVPEGSVISKEGAPVDQVHYVIKGSTRIDKMGESFRMPEGWFTGEVAYLTGRPSVATTICAEDAELLSWNVKELKAKAIRSARFKVAFEAMVSHNLAVKVSYAVAPQSLKATKLEQDATA